MRNFCFLLGSSILLAGCSLGLTGKAPPFLLNLSPATSPAANAGETIAQGDAITIATPLVPQAIATTRVPVSQGETAIAYVPDAVWVEQPARLFQRLLSETVRARTGRTVLDPRQFAMEPGLQLSGQLLQFTIDERSGRAVVIYDASLSGAADKKVRTRRFEARVPIGKIDARNVGVALNSAANRVAGEVADWIGR